MTNISSLLNDREAYNRGCGTCHQEALHAVRDLHQIGIKLYDQGTPIESSKTVWAPCSQWRYGCAQHPPRAAVYFEHGRLCPHGSTALERGVPTPAMPIVGRNAIVLETDI